jgi:hypothetical protein
MSKIAISLFAATSDLGELLHFPLDIHVSVFVRRIIVHLFAHASTKPVDVPSFIDERDEHGFQGKSFGTG